MNIIFLQGVHRTYPGKQWSMSNGAFNPYDPRFRPWFVEASSGPKNVVLLIDVSGSMNIAIGGESRINLAKVRGI